MNQARLLIAGAVPMFSLEREHAMQAHVGRPKAPAMGHLDFANQNGPNHLSKDCHE